MVTRINQALGDRIGKIESPAACCRNSTPAFEVVLLIGEFDFVRKVEIGLEKWYLRYPHRIHPF